MMWKWLAMIGIFVCAWSFAMACSQCTPPLPPPQKPTLANTPYSTKHVILVIIDGVRYTETWGYPDKKNIPNIAHVLAPQGTVYTNFRNEGNTYTVSGHGSILTGSYIDVDNFGFTSPPKPSFLQLWRDASLQPKNKAWIVSGKAHLDALANSTASAWKDRALPSDDCGEAIDGHKIYVRSDQKTFQTFLDILKREHPSLAVLALPNPDKIGHEYAGTFAKKWSRWERYLASIRENDQYLATLWSFLQKDPFYRDKTALFVTHDHGRHTNGHLEKTFDHGDDCEGCRRLILLALGPDFKRNHVVHEKAEQIDLAPTIGHLLGFSVDGAKGRVLKEMLR